MTRGQTMSAVAVMAVGRRRDPAGLNPQVSH